MKKSQRANHAVMEIRNIRVLNHNATEYLCIWTSNEKKDRIREVVHTGIFYRIHCNFKTIMNSLSPPRDFSQLGFSCKNPLSSCVYYAEIFNYHRKTERSIRSDVRSIVLSIVLENLHHSRLAYWSRSGFLRSRTT